ncbi:unnamed protein product [Aureobasidium mustum]|uniref:Amino acid permease/ SLC12A domain-containing protein n=1 Tax=Aureobasidium mustum TaxID=2773714 RepID=A0A9N8KAQ6_9PEZI|nr:unnamed protein product [Aureobasidium mustum]
MPFWDKNEKTGDVISQAPSDPITRDSHDEGIVHDNADHLQRRLGNRQIQLIAIGGSIGTALFVSIGGGLVKGGPGSLLVAYAVYSAMLGFVNNCIAEMTILFPMEGGFIRLAGHFVDEAFGYDHSLWSPDIVLTMFPASWLAGTSSFMSMLPLQNTRRWLI